MEQNMEPQKGERIRTNDMGVARKQLDRVGSLDLSYQKRSEVPKEIAEMVNLRSLELHGNEFKDVDQLVEMISKLPHLRYLTLPMGQCSHLSPAIGELKSLDWLILSGKGLHALPATFGQLQNMTKLWLWVSNWLGEDDHLEPVGKLSQLTSMSLEVFGTNPRGWQHLKQVKELDCNYLRQTPVGLSGMTSLEKLRLTYDTDNAEGTMDLAELDGLHQLKSLSIGSKTPKAFPKSLKGLANLEELKMEFNDLEVLPDALADLKGIKRMQLGRNRIVKLPSWIGELKSLEELDLHENQLKDLPDELKQAAQLKVLQLEQNQFTVFPKVLVEVPALESVILGRNKITTVPDLNPSASSLKYISLRLNKLEAFPWTLAALPNTKLDFEGNPFVKAAGYKIDNVIAAVSGAAHSPTTRNTLLALAMGDIPKALQSGSLEDFVTGLNDAEAKVRAYSLEAITKFLPDPFAGELAPISIRIVGQYKAYPIADYKKQLEAKKIKVNKGKPGEVDVVVFAEKPGSEADEYLKAGAKAASIAQLANFIDALDKPWLRKKAEEQPKVGENIGKLLESGNLENIQLALNMMSKGGVPDGLLSSVLALNLLHPDAKTRKAAEQVFEAYASPSLKSFLQANKRNLLTMKEDKLVDHLQKLIQFEEIDAHAFGKMAFVLNKELGPVFAPHVRPEDLDALVDRNGFLRLPTDRMAEIPQGLLDADKVDSIWFAVKNWKTLPIGIGRIKGLRRLDLSSNKLVTLPDEMRLLQDLEFLDLGSNGIKQFPTLLFDLGKLEVLDLSFNDLSKLPNELAQFKKLKSLRIFYHKFAAFPAVLEQMTQLEALDLGAADDGPAWKEFPMGILKLRNLRSLKLSRHWMPSVPEALQELPLEELEVETNRLPEFPHWLTTMKGLKRLNIFKNRSIDHLPEDIGKMTGLEELNIGKTLITKLPDAFSKLQNLRDLDISGLKFEDPAATLAILKQLPAITKIVYQDSPDMAFKGELAKAFPKARIV
ncbi:MAG: hypothetical protein RLZZ519_2024 [Bacteroidota bacterium]|jgi:Leucine-rich repeat (LRR) protein